MSLLSSTGKALPPPRTLLSLLFHDGHVRLFHGSRRFDGRVKKKWPSKYKPVGASHLALEFMDAHYPRLYGPKLWTQMRVAMLSRQKYAMLFNSYQLDLDRCHAAALEAGAAEIMGDVRTRLSQFQAGNFQRTTAEAPPLPTEDDERFAEEEGERYADRQREILLNVDGSADESLDFFMPAKEIYFTGVGVDLTFDQEEEREAGFYEARQRPHQFDFEEATDGGDGAGAAKNRMASCIDGIPTSLQVAMSPKGHVETYPKPYVQYDRLGYYLLDAASILPVVAMDLKDDDVVADICAAPGGKSLAMIFTKTPRMVFAIDKSWSRMLRFKEVMFSYLPKDVILRDSPDCRLEFLTRDANMWTPEGILFDKVLADVPCSSDRFSVTSDEDNIFSVGKMRERELLPEYQALLLYNAYMLCKPGGFVVYSTCTLSPSQNDGVIRRFFEQFKKVHPLQPQPVLSSLNSLTELFKLHYNFFFGCQYGIQVIPTLKANFGPMYICRIRKPDPNA